MLNNKNFEVLEKSYISITKNTNTAITDAIQY